MTHKGFTHDGKQIYFIDPRGKDISFERWRLTLYYEPHLASTEFFTTQADYDQFIVIHTPACYADYDQYRAAWDGGEG